MRPTINKTEYYLTDKAFNFRFDFKIVIGSGSWPKRYNEVFCKYDILAHDNVTTDIVTASHDFAHTDHVAVASLDVDATDFFKTGALIVKIRGRQKADLAMPVNEAAKVGKTTRQIRAVEELQRRESVQGSHQRLREIQFRKMEEKLTLIQKLCDEGESKGETTIPIADTRHTIGGSFVASRETLAAVGSREGDGDGDDGGKKGEGDDGERKVVTRHRVSFAAGEKEDGGVRPQKKRRNFSFMCSVV